MRPIELTMTAFGPYAQKAHINFDDLNRGIYLISGDTGAGKTTIFDAIVFALYGEASGKSRRADMLHSDFVSKGEDAQVTLRFSNNGREYTVRRTIHYPRTRGQKDEYSVKPNYTAVLYEPEREPVEKAEAVTARIRELLGLDADQFRKIVMLAQGEFRAFLEADSAARGTILGKIFDNSTHIAFQDSLKEAAKLLSDAREEQKRIVRDRLAPGAFRLPETMSGEQRALFDPDHPSLEANIDALIQQDEVALAAVQTQMDKAHAVQNERVAKKKIAEQNNGMLDELEKARAQEKTLSGQKDEYDRQREIYQRAEKALRDVKPAYDVHGESEKRLQQNRCKAADLARDIQAQKTVCEQKNARLAHCSAQQGKIDFLHVAIDRLEKALPQYDDMEKLQKDLAAEQDRAKKSAGEKERLQNAVRQGKERLLQIENALRGTEGCEERAARLDAKRNDLRRQYKELDEIIKNIAAVRELERAQTAKQAEYRRASDASAKADATFRALNEAFIGGQAACLAKELHDAIDREGQGVCPVCKSVFCRENRPPMLPDMLQTPTKEAVDSAADAKKRADDRLSALREENARAMTELQEKKNAVVEKAGEYIGECDWDRIRDGSMLSLKKDSVEAEGKENKAQYEKEEAKKQQAKRLRDEKGKLDTGIAESEQALEQERARVEQAQKNCARTETALSEKKAHLEYETKAAAQERIKACKSECASMESELQNAQKEKQAADNAMHGMQGEQRSLEETIAGGERECAESGRQLLKSLTQAGFADANEYMQSLAPVGQTDAKEWLDAQQAKDTQYRDAVKANHVRIEQMERQTQGLERMDMAALQKEIDEGELQWKNTQKMRDEANSILDSHRHVRDEIQRALAELRTSEAAYERLHKLSEMAQGRGDGEGVGSFDRFALGEFFREILDEANVHLVTMSGGKYTLVHQLKGERRNSAAGLNIEVQDAFTGEQRKTASLSGGESFQVSMALALGLSGVVQAHAGGREVESMFIDEGFGSLDESVLEKAIEVLGRLAGDRRQIGIISHVAKLEECIPQKIVVYGSPKGSSLRVMQ